MQPKQELSQDMSSRIAVIRIRGICKIKGKIEDTLRMMRLFKKNHCAIIKNDAISQGMLQKVKDYVTWGELNEDTMKLLLEKRGRIMGNKPLHESWIKDKTTMSTNDFIKAYFDMKTELKHIPGFKPYFRLSPPKRGFERKGIKKPYSMGGVLGYRKDHINELIQRMI